MITYNRRILDLIICDYTNVIQNFWIELIQLDAFSFNI